ncbi:MAG TPA: metal-dependent hydrolase [Methylomirabilota bacterium]|jgi:inner membrane protein
MPTIMSHAVVGLALGTLTSFPHRRRTFWLASAALPVLPDLDVFGRAFGISFYSTWGHRGISHSFAAAAVIGVVAAVLLRRRLGAPLPPLALYFALITASHGVLDALTDGGPGVAFFAPFDGTRYFFPWRPIPVSPLVSRFFSEWGWRVFSAELALIWLPAAFVILVARARRG